MSTDITTHGMLANTTDASILKAQVKCKEIAAEDECNNTVCGNCATAFGCSTKAFGDCSLSEGSSTKAYGANSHAEGNNTTANGDNSHAEGCTTVAFGNCSHSEGSNTNTYADSSHTEGYNTKTRGIRSHAEGILTEANAEGSHAQGYNTRAEGFASFADGNNTQARGYSSHTEGYNTSTTYDFAHAEGYSTQASGYSAHAEGYYTTAKGNYSHAEGYYSSPNNNFTHTEGYYTKADGYSAHAEGYYASAAGSYSHAEGNNTVANASYSHAEGLYTNTRGAVGSHIMGVYGDADTPYSWFLGGGTSDSDRSLAAKILYTGDAYIRNAWNAGGTGYAEMFKSKDQAIEPGYFVTLRDDNIQPANGKGDYILGVTTSAPGFVANSIVLKQNANLIGAARSTGEENELVIPEVKDYEGKLLASEQIVKVPVPALGTPSATLYSTSDNYWNVVALIGQVVVNDDGTCKPNHYCLPNETGIATEAMEGFRVMRRLSENTILIMFR